MCLTLFHQYPDQLAPPFRQVAFGNVGTLVAFKLGSANADPLAREFGETHVPRQFVDLERFEVLVRLLQDGQHREPFHGSSLPPLENHVGRAARLLARSRERFAAPRAVVEAKLAQWTATG